MFTTSRPDQYPTGTGERNRPRPRYNLRPDPSAVLIRRAVQASRIAKELDDPATEAAYLETARMLLEFRLEAVRQELGR